jgi:membrane protease YdiL (CAAX protease family)
MNEEEREHPIPNGSPPEVSYGPSPGPLPVQSGLHPYAKVAIYLVGYFVVAMVLSILAAIVFAIAAGAGIVHAPILNPSISPTNVQEILKLLEPYLLPLVIATGLYTILYTWAFVRIVDRRRLSSLGLKLRPGWAGDFWRGAGLALLILAAVFAFSLLTGSIRVEGFERPAPAGTNVFAYLLGAVVAFLIVGFYEEMMFRGYVLQRIHERAGVVPSIVVSSFLFAILHAANPGADVFGIMNTVIIGVLLALLYLRSGALWMPIGFHFAWNFSLGYVYSLPVSGLPVHGILKVTETEGTSRLTGGSYGPEAGLLLTIVLAAWGAWLIWRTTARRRGG